MSNTSELDFSKIYEAYRFIGISLSEFNSLVDNSLYDYKLEHDASKLDSETAEKVIVAVLEDKISRMFDSYKESLLIINSYIYNFCIPSDSYETCLKQIKDIIEFLEKYEYIPDPNIVIELLEGNQTFKKIIENIFEKNSNIITEGKAQKIYNNDIFAEFMEIYCMTEQIETKEEESILEEVEELSEENQTKEKEKKDAVDNSVLPIERAYITSIAEFKVLTREEEVALSKRIKNGDEDAREEFINRNLKLVVSVAKRFSGYGISLMDIINYGNIGLIVAVERFDYQKGFRFSSYAVQCIKSEIYSGILTNDRFIKLPAYKIKEIKAYNDAVDKLQIELGRTPTSREIAAEMGIDEAQLAKIIKNNKETISLSELVLDGDSELGDFIPNDEETPEEITEANSLEENIRILIKNCNLNKKEEYVIKHRFGLDGVPMRTLESIGEEFSVTRERIRQIEDKALKKLRYSKYIKAFAIYMDNPKKALEFIEEEKRKHPLYREYGTKNASNTNPKKYLHAKKKKDIVDDSNIDLSKLTSEDEARLSDLLVMEELRTFQTIISIPRFIIVMLYFGFVNGKKFPTSTISEYLNMDENEIEATIESADKYYGQYINKMLKEVNNMVSRNK